MKTIYSNKWHEILVCDSDYELFKHMKWNVDYRGYARAYKGQKKDNGKWYTKTLHMHRMFYKSDNNTVIDHINRNRLDNRRCNLRLVSKSQNALNSDRLNRWKSGLYGVTIRPRKNKIKWVAAITYKDESLYIGIFDTKEEAARAYDKKCLELRGEFAVLNFPDDKV